MSDAHTNDNPRIVTITVNGLSSVEVYFVRRGDTLRLKKTSGYTDTHVRIYGGLLDHLVEITEQGRDYPVSDGAAGAFHVRPRTGSTVFGTVRTYVEVDLDAEQPLHVQAKLGDRIKFTQHPDADRDAVYVAEGAFGHNGGKRHEIDDFEQPLYEISVRQEPYTIYSTKTGADIPGGIVDLGSINVGGRPF